MRWSRRGRKPRVQCETCGRYVKRSKAVELTAVVDIDPDEGVSRLEGGSVTATFCRKDAPKERAA